MKKFYQFPLYAVLAIACMFTNLSCSDDDDDDWDDSEKEKIYADIVSQYVNNTVIVTYKSLADETINLYNALVTLQENKTNANVIAAVNSWIRARNYWELSEAFLFGPADHFSIDPHIDTWPLAKDALIATLNNDAYIENMSKDNGDVWVSEALEFGLLGFHGIEYILFEDGDAKDAEQITDRELIYCVAVAGDVRNQCFRLEAAWAGIDNVTAEKKAKLQALNADITYSTTNYSYGHCMLNPGTTTFCETIADACELILEGCIDIADEVGNLKIGKPYHGEDVNYIESPYSYNSKVDFIGNMESILNVYMGGVSGRRGASISDYIKSIDPALDEEVKAAIYDAIEKIEAIPYPFAKNYDSPQAGAAIEACDELMELLEEVQDVLLKD